MDNIKKLVEEDVFGAITLDTSIFDRHNLNLESGSLKHLRQFRHGWPKLILSDIVYKEVINHLVRDATAARTELEKVLNQIRIPWLVDENKLNEVKKSLIGDNSAETLSEKRLQTFIHETNAEVVKASKLIDVENVINRYFEARPPFADTGKKKNEFPDAIALLTIDAWAKKHNTKVLVITTDNDWKRYCSESERLIFIEDINLAFSLFQLQTSAYEVCSLLSKEIKKHNNLPLFDLVKNALRDQIWKINFIPEAEAAYSYESEITEIVYKHFAFNVVDDPDIYLFPIEVDEGYIVTEANLKVEYEVESHFSFFVWDSLDKDNIPIGTGRKTVKVTINVDVLITLNTGDEENLVKNPVEGVEVLDTHNFYVDFGFVDLEWDGGVDDYD